MPLTLQLPPPLDEEVTEEAQREGVSAAEHATLLLYLGSALLSEDRPTPFKEAVRVFLTRHSLDAHNVTSAFEELVRFCLKRAEGKATPSIQGATGDFVDGELVLLKQWRDAKVHGANVNPRAIGSTLGRPTEHRLEQGEKQPSHEQIHGSELAARVKSIRGRFACAEGDLASEELHRERQADKEKEELQIPLCRSATAQSYSSDSDSSAQP
jgi:hypothetical protein